MLTQFEVFPADLRAVTDFEACYAGADRDYFARAIRERHTAGAARSDGLKRMLPSGFSDIVNDHIDPA